MSKPSFTAAFPHSAAVISDFKKAFGAGVKPLYCAEAGGEVGMPLDETRYTVIAGDDLIIKKTKKGNQ